MAKLTYLEFEKPVSVLEDKIAELQKVSEDPNSINIQSEIDKLERKKDQASQRYLQQAHSMECFFSCASSAETVYA